MVNLHEIVFKPAVFRPFSIRFSIIFTHATDRLYLAAARRDDFQLSRGPKAGARKSLYFRG
jgi:hypothetical protein